MLISRRVTQKTVGGLKQRLVFFSIFFGGFDYLDIDCLFWETITIELAERHRGLRGSRLDSGQLWILSGPVSKSLDKFLVCQCFLSHCWVFALAAQWIVMDIGRHIASHFFLEFCCKLEEIYTYNMVITAPKIYIESENCTPFFWAPFLFKNSLWSHAPWAVGM